jgi:hypothetical protein
MSRKRKASASLSAVAQGIMDPTTAVTLTIPDTITIRDHITTVITIMVTLTVGITGGIAGTTMIDRQF